MPLLNTAKIQMFYLYSKYFIYQPALPLSAHALMPGMYTVATGMV